MIINCKGEYSGGTLIQVFFIYYAHLYFYFIFIYYAHLYGNVKSGKVLAVICLDWVNMHSNSQEFITDSSTVHFNQ